MKALCSGLLDFSGGIFVIIAIVYGKFGYRNSERHVFLRYGFFWVASAFKYHASSLCRDHFYDLGKNSPVHP